MKTILIILLLVFSNVATAKETINVYSKFNLSDVGTQQINGIIIKLNSMSDKYTFKLNSIPGAFGEASVRRSIADARAGVKSILFTTVDTLTVLKELETSDQKFEYDKSRDLTPLQGISSTFHGVFGSPEIQDFDMLVNQLKTQKEFFYGYTSNAVVPKLSADILVKHYGLNNGKVVLYKSQADLQLAVINKEIVFGVGSITEAVSDSNLKLLLRMIYSPFETLHREVQTFSFDEPAKYVVSKQSDTVLVQLPLEANHPVEEILWFVRRKGTGINNEWTNYSDTLEQEWSLASSALVKPLLVSAGLQVNGIQYVQAEEQYFRQHIAGKHSGGYVAYSNFVYGISFAETPGKHQPSGSINASRANSIRLNLEVRPPGGVLDASWEIKVYCIGMNWLRFQNGLANPVFED